MSEYQKALHSVYTEIYFFESIFFLNFLFYLLIYFSMLKIMFFFTRTFKQMIFGLFFYWMSEVSSPQVHTCLGEC